MKTLFRAAALGALLVTAGAACASAQTVLTAADTQFKATTLNLSAYGETRIAPDMATITLGVNVESPTAAEAMKANAVRMNQVIAALKKAGIESRDIQTSGLNLNPQYVYEQNQPPKLTGYQAANQVTVRVRDLAKLGQAVDATVNAGANTIHGVSFGLSDPEGAENAARREAVKALEAKAGLYAQATGYKIVRLVQLNESGGYSPEPPRPVMMMAMKRESGDSTPVEGGELRVRIDVSATFEAAR